MNFVLSLPMKLSLNLLIIFIIVSSSSIWADTLVISSSAYLDIYYQYDFRKPTTEKRLPFLYNHTRHHQLALNHALVQTTIAYGKWSTRLGAQAGSYVNDNYVQEPRWLQFINEAALAFQFDSVGKHKIEAGIFPSHIGYESALSYTNTCLSRSLMAENSPYFESGIKYVFRPSSSWTMNALLLTGWQRIQFAPGNSLPAIGTQLTYTGKNNYTYNWSTFAGTESPDTARQMRYFTNCYISSPSDKKWSYTIALDMGLQQKTVASNDYDSWFTSNAVVRYAFAKSWSVALRGEYYSDASGIIIGESSNVCGASANIDYHPHDQLYIRAEYRYLNGSAIKSIDTSNVLCSAVMKFGE
jgi:hypothetical protein